MQTNKLKTFLNTIIWGFIVWFVGYILGFVFFAIVPKEFIGWAIMPFGIAFTLWALISKIKRDRFKCYIGLAVIWTILAVVLDYFLLVKLLNAVGYYKLDVYVYYILTFVLPLCVGWYKFKRNN
ncbi:MAG: hypothetical protein WCF94_01985 [bacterium]